jgi:hypothetical protein
LDSIGTGIGGATTKSGGEHAAGRTGDVMTDTIRSEQRGFHWVAWLASGQDGKPADSVLMVGKTREEAEARLKALAESR